MVGNTSSDEKETLATAGRYPWLRIVLTFAFGGALMGGLLWVLSWFVVDTLLCRAGADSCEGLNIAEHGVLVPAFMMFGVIFHTPALLLVALAACVGKWHRAAVNYIQTAAYAFAFSVPYYLLLLDNNSVLSFLRPTWIIGILPLVNMCCALLLGRWCFPQAGVSDGLLPESRKNQNE